MADDEGFTFDYLIARSSNRSRFWLTFRFFSQNTPFVAGILECFGQKCQKQPSTNTATRSLGNTKSGFPNTGRFLRHPVIPFSRNTAINASSVARFPLLRIRDITSERFALEKTSGIVGGKLSLTTDLLLDGLD